MAADRAGGARTRQSERVETLAAPAARYEIRQVGGETILEYWIPAEDLEELNDNIVGEIEEVAHFE